MKLPTLLFSGALCLVAPFKTLAESKSQKANTSIYGTDDRLEISQITDEKVKNMSRAIVLFTNARLIVPVRDAQGNETGDYVGKGFSPDLPQDGVFFRDERRFSKQANAGFCSGFLIDSTHIMTAGHCIEGTETCETMRFVFDYTAEPGDAKQRPVIPGKNIKTCKKLMYAPNALDRSAPDYGIVELSEPELDRPTFKLTTDTKKPAVGTVVAMLGHPSGKPMKYTAGGAQVLRDHGIIRRRSIVNKYEFVTNLDAFSGNSGSVVFDPTTLEVQGILVAGAEDAGLEGIRVYDQVYTQNPSVEQINKVPGILGERVTSIATIQDQIIETLAGRTATPDFRPLNIAIPGGSHSADVSGVSSAHDE